MAAFNKFQDFIDQVYRGKHDFGAHAFKVMLTNAAPLATNSVKADLTEIASGAGYPAGGIASTLSVSEVGGTLTVTASDVVFTAAGGDIGPARYAVIYNDTQTSPAKPLVGFWDYGASITITDGNTLTVDLGTLLTAS